MREHLLIFARYPEEGKTKTRLASTLGNKAACEIYKKMAEIVIATVSGKFALSVLLTPSDKLSEAQSWLSEKANILAQAEGDLGAKLEAAFLNCFENGNDRVIAIGTDCIDITAELIAEAFDKLKENDCVIGPAKDGGYYLIGLSKPTSIIFQNITWSSSSTLKETTEKLKANNYSYTLLKELSDIDTAEDLELFPQLLQCIKN